MRHPYAKPADSAKAQRSLFPGGGAILPVVIARLDRATQ